MTAADKGYWLFTILKLIVIFTITMVGVALLTLMERKVSAWMQNRRGPNRVGWAGLLQPAADGIKNIIKEETLPSEVNMGIFMLAPALAFIPALLLGAVIPWAAPMRIDWDAHIPLLGAFSYHGMLTMALTDLPVGFLFVLAISSLGVYGIALAGWASNNKYSLLGGLRSSAQMISYEVAMGMSLIPVLLLTGNVTFQQIIASQQQGLWFILPLFLSFFIFLVAGFAETNRLPFDLPEAESELIAGYHTEYSAMKFSMFPISEYSNMATVSAMLVTLFFGGWDIPFTSWDQNGSGLATLATAIFMFLKVMFFLFFFMWIRWTLPRFRYDQLMALGWKVLLPLSLGYIMITCLGIWGLEHLAGVTSPRIKMLALFGVNVVIGYLVFFLLDRGHILSGSYRASSNLDAGGRSTPGGGLMAIGVKVLKRPERQVSYVRAALKGMALTFKHMLQPKVTMQYPEEKSTGDERGHYTISPRWRGTHRMLSDEQGRTKCVACGLCPQICPANCIKLVPGEDESGNRFPLIYEIDEFRCVFCGYCQEVCPEEAIHVGVHFENSEYSRDRFVYDLERLSSQVHPVSTLWDPSDPKGE